MLDNNKLKILFVSAEVAPFAKTGGLADVAGSLPQTLAGMGNDIRVVMPRYKSIKGSMKYVTDFPVKIDYRQETCIVRETDMDFKSGGGSKRVPVYFIDNYHYYDRDGIYCYMDDGERFAYFCKAVIEMLPRIDFQPDVIHCNDWHTGPICMLLKEQYKEYPFYSNISTVFTIHNLEYQGHFSKDILKAFNIGEEVFVPEKVEFYGRFNFMKAGIVYSDIVTAVSETYSKEIQTAQFGEKLDGLLKERAKDLCGIVNGISYTEFDPANDPKIYKNYNEQNYTNKKENKHGLQKEIGLPVRDVPLMGIVSRLAGQKGLNFIVDTMDEILKNDVQFVLLGLGDPYYENAFKDFQDKYPDKVRVFIEFNAALAQKIYAGSDIFLMPSRFEPCGLGQLISLRYGTIPIVRETGGLADTIIDYDADNINGNGFLFSEMEPGEFLKTVERALKLYNTSPDKWQMLVKRGLSLDFSWNRAAQKYMDAYKTAIEKNKGK